MEQNFLLLNGAVRVHLEHGQAPEEIVPVPKEAARLAREQERHSLLVVSGGWMIP